MLKPGDIAPEIDAPTTSGARFLLSAQRGPGPTVLYFFPKAFTPGCAREADRFRADHAEIVLAGGRVVGVSTDDHATQCRFAKDVRAPFPMIGDADKRIARAYGVLWPIVERPMRVTFVIGADRRIEAVFHHEIDVKSHASEALRALDRARQRRSVRPVEVPVDVDATIAVDRVRIRMQGRERFDVLWQAGTGAMGTVYEAFERARERTVALKILGKEADRARFAREADVISRVTHPNVVGYVGHGVCDNGRTWLAMEWVEGETLACKLARGALETRETLRVVRDVARGLGAVHAAGVVHRDIKPSNVLVTRAGVAKILDFGIARAPEGLIEGLTRTGELVGTPAYMAPEQARAGAKVDARTDLFALGCVLYRCITGRRVFEGSDLMEVLYQVISADAPRLHGVSPELERLCAQLLEKDMDARPASAHEVAARLDAMLDASARTPRDAAVAC